MKNDVWRNFFNKPKLTSSITNISEIGFSHYGPTFAIAGTITAINTVVLIHNICTEVTAIKSKSSHFLDWFAFRPFQYKMGKFSGMDLNMAAKYAVAPDKPKNHNTLFIDSVRFAEMKPLFSAIKTTWEDSLSAAAKSNTNISSSQVFSEFKNLKVIQDACERLKSMNYWEPGDYTAKVRITTLNPKQYFDVTHAFSLNDVEAKMLTGNVPAIISNICQQSLIPYYCATPILLTKK